ncbi:MAG: protein translocase subunit SecF [bacterium]|nr:protein translocase subunit SecF [bacterium]MDA1024464.1 protein translocase subunit SecF [bacterium]
MQSFEIIKRSPIWLGISSLLVIASMVAILTFGLNLGIDFTGGSLLEVNPVAEVSLEEMRAASESAGYDASVQTTDGGFLLKTEPLTREQHDELLAAFAASFGEFEELRFESVGPVIGDELKRRSIVAVALLLALIVVYVAWAFRKVSEPISSWKYGLLTIIAAIHDVMIPLGVFAVLGSTFGYQVDTAVVAALLTILGYSINDTIVVFDRTRENLTQNRHKKMNFGEVVNMSVVQSFARSMNTSLTTLLVLLAIYFFGGETTRPFILALIIGVVSGAYSSIFVASPLLVLWEKMGSKGKE